MTYDLTRLRRLLAEIDLATLALRHAVDAFHQAVHDPPRDVIVSPPSAAQISPDE